jgi:hypothetical protein
MAPTDRDQRGDRGGAALGGGVEQQRRLQALADHRDERDAGHRERTHPDRGLEPAGELALEPPRRPAHPEDHPGHEDDGEDRRDGLEELP